MSIQVKCEKLVVVPYEVFSLTFEIFKNYMSEVVCWCLEMTKRKSSKKCPITRVNLNRVPKTFFLKCHWNFGFDFEDDQNRSSNNGVKTLKCGYHGQYGQYAIQVSDLSFRFRWLEFRKKMFLKSRSCFAEAMPEKWSFPGSVKLYSDYLSEYRTYDGDKFNSQTSLGGHLINRERKSFCKSVIVHCSYGLSYGHIMLGQSRPSTRHLVFLWKYH